MKIPHSNGVVKAIRAVRAAAKKSLKGLNALAAQRMARGDYATAEALAGKGKELREFQSEVEVLRQRWRIVCDGGDRSTARARTPLWTYYQPILQALVQAGGDCRQADLEMTVERLMDATLQPDDGTTAARGRERRRVMLLRARKPMMAEGWIEKNTGKLWRVTDAGRRAAESHEKDFALRP